MTALPLEPHTEAEEATLARFEAAEPDENGAVEKVARALCGARGCDGTWHVTSPHGHDSVSSPCPTGRVWWEKREARAALASPVAIEHAQAVSR